MRENSIQVLSNSADDRELVLDFFCVFSRFEYALKQAKFLQRLNGIAEASWDLYANSIFGRFKSEGNAQFVAARQVLEVEPPKRHIVIDGKLDWRPSKREHGESEERYVLRLVETVRNNLFHGGKFPGRSDSGTDRNRELICASLRVLEFCLSLNHRVGEYFVEGA